MITVHLREDRRHIRDRDVELLRQTVKVPLNLEMAALDEIVTIALRFKPRMVTLVPEKRTEVTTEGGLNVAGNAQAITAVVGKLAAAGITCSAFIDADPRQVHAAKKAGFAICELHTGPYALAPAGKTHDVELERIRAAGEEILNSGMQLNAGHGLNYTNVLAIACLPHLSELHIGHAIVSRAIFTGLRDAVALMKSAINCAS
ncbi:Pyridoxal phosphate (active vitamin B6) biosynthesis PdxJ [mine drainage metagenome]|uniref:Pyridoxal phosphate (Active vitamin B6) biosynthesis PdxJ n=1 Tax=mine drainage metagenome TaxID=410659 RepID=T1C6M6_9ZZZZ